MNETRKKLIVAATGASGMPLLKDCLHCIRQDGQYETILILSKHAVLTMKYETDVSADEITALADTILPPDDIAAGPASGTYPAAGMIIVPCSMKTIAGINTGYSDNLILRAADVTIKEQRPLALSVRESPLSRIHLKNMYELSEIPGIHIIPPMMMFYNNPLEIGDMVRHNTGKLLSPFGINVEGFMRWESNQSNN